MWVVMLVAHQNPLARPAHSMLAIVLLKSSQAGYDRRIFFWLRLLGAKGVVAEGIEADGGWLVRVEGLGDCGTMGFKLLLGLPAIYWRGHGWSGIWG